MSDSDFGEVPPALIEEVEAADEFKATSIKCMDCTGYFVWTAGEQRFFHDKNLIHPPKRCKDCKKAKNRRIAAVSRSRITGKRQHIEVRAQCAQCAVVSTVPFYPSQGRPVYCRACFEKMTTFAKGATA